jgi:hypothetical protein
MDFNAVVEKDCADMRTSHHLSVWLRQVAKETPAGISEQRVIQALLEHLIESVFLLSAMAATRIYHGVNHTVGSLKRGGCQARSKAIGSGPILAGVRAFKSHPPHRIPY